MSAHTPLPWRVTEEWRDKIEGADGTVVSQRDLESVGLSSADAALVVRCVNAHAVLVDALRELANASDYADGLGPVGTRSRQIRAIQAARVLLARIAS